MRTPVRSMIYSTPDLPGSTEGMVRSSAVAGGAKFGEILFRRGGLLSRLGQPHGQNGGVGVSSLYTLETRAFTGFQSER